MGKAYDLIGTSSSAVNDQLVPRIRAGNYFPRPISAGGPGGGGVPAFPPQSVGGGTVGGGASGKAAGAAAAQSAGANPWSPVASPVPWLIGFFVLGVLLLRFVHHGY